MNLNPRIILLGAFLLVLAAGVSRAATAEDKAVKVTANDQMKYDVTRIEANVDQKIVITLTNIGKLPKAAMAHNLVILKPGTDARAFAAAATGHVKEGYLPPEQADKVLAATKLLGPGESDTITFTPTAPGTYEYVCTFPPHMIVGMHGVITVK